MCLSVWKRVSSWNCGSRSYRFLWLYALCCNEKSVLSFLLITLRDSQIKALLSKDTENSKRFLSFYRRLHGLHQPKRVVRISPDECFPDFA